MQIIDEEAAARSIRLALLGEESPKAVLAALAVLAWTSRSAPKDLLEVIWDSVGLAVVARRPIGLVPALQVAGSGYRKFAAIPVRIDGLLSQGLELLLLDSGPAARSSQDHYLDRARRWGAALVASMQGASRGEENVLQAWRSAESSDPLANIRWASKLPKI